MAKLPAGVRRRSDGRFEKKFTVNDKRYSVYGNTAKEVLEHEIEKRKKISLGLEKVLNPTLDEYYKHFTEIRRKEVRGATIRGQLAQYNNIASVELANGTKFGEMKIRSITGRHIEDVRNILLENGKTPENLNICFAHLKHVFNSAVKDDTIEKNPCRALKPLKRSGELIGKNRHRALTNEETKKFFECAKARNSFYYHAFDFMIKTGLRIGEVTALLPVDIDTKNNFIHVRRTISRDEVGGYFLSDETKTEHGTRDIPLTQELLSIIRDQQALNRMIFGFKKTDSMIFKSSEGNILREYTLNREIKRICNDAGIQYFTCHCFRNTFATRFIEQRPQDFKILSEIMGHAGTGITLNLYTHVMTENKVKAMSEISIKTV